MPLNPILTQTNPLSHLWETFGWHIFPAKREGVVLLLLFQSKIENRQSSMAKQSQFFHGQICVINIKNAKMEAKKLGKKTKQTQLWITLNVR